MEFCDVLLFLKKRFEELGFSEELSKLFRVLNELRVTYKDVMSLEAGLIIDPLYKKFGFSEK